MCSWLRDVAACLALLGACLALWLRLMWLKFLRFMGWSR